MQAANRVKVEKQVDHVVLHFSVSGGDASDLGEPIVSLLLPISAAGPLAFDLFEAVYKSAVGIQAMFQQLNELNDKLKLLESPSNVPKASS